MSIANKSSELSLVKEFSRGDKYSVTNFQSLHNCIEIGGRPSVGNAPRHGFLQNAFRRSALTFGMLAILETGVSVAEASQSASANPLVIYSDNGGKLSKYAVAVSNARAMNTSVKIKGKCQSACTLYLSMPQSQICISRGASFVFHKAHGSSARLNNWGTQFLLANYPAWVQNWINSKGGLSNNLIRMNYEYASRYLPPCSTQQSKQRRTLVRSVKPKTSVQTHVSELGQADLVARVPTRSYLREKHADLR
ncbi:hypothetical protein SAMN05444000_1503 [Shimia gijangensis]|uniref:Uncharacterized protein n=1 Tax=Shimia gijangensis TaxID=1470563 RepID=A0A1M6U2J2_9RHOB|nr:hypothetical protein [Shimia gijangensis]SHK63364.1 hypothetical protein SAMN05444000_1503 [Shimia gijangensis]